MYARCRAYVPADRRLFLLALTESALRFRTIKEERVVKFTRHALHVPAAAWLACIGGGPGDSPPVNTDGDGSYQRTRRALRVRERGDHFRGRKITAEL